MFTAEIKNKFIQRAQNKIALDLEISDGTTVYIEKMFFPLNMTEDGIKATVKHYLDQLERAQTFVDNLPLGIVDTSTVVDTTPTQADLDKQDWFRRFGRLQTVQKMIDLGILTGNETQITALRNGLKTDFKVAYLQDI